jgi:ubiquinone biosynthesis protein
MNNSITQLIRFIHIQYVLAKHGLDAIVLDLQVLSPIRFLAYLNPWYWIRNRNIPRGERLRLALIELGPIFVKFGQTLSTRRDLLPEDIADELALLQDKVPPFANAKAAVAKAYKVPFNTIFESFDETALASASIAQVHVARLCTGEDVIVKVLRPNVEKIIKRDIGLLYRFAGIAERYSIMARHLHVVDLVREFENTTLAELDLNMEASNASALKRNFKGSTLLHVPEIYWPYVTSSVIVMEHIHGVPIGNVDELRALGVDMKVLAERGVEIFFTQVFRDCFFHADMHPGNIFVDVHNLKQPIYMAVDFGIMGALSPNDQHYLASNLLAFFKRDYRKVALLHLESGWVPADTRVEDFEAAVRSVCEPIFERPLKDISFGKLLLRLFQVGRKFHMEIQPQLLLLEKTLFHIEGLGRQLYPELDLWATAHPFLEKWMHKQVGIRANLRRLKESLPLWSKILPELPATLQQTLKLIQDEKKDRKEDEKDVSRQKNSGLRRGLGAGFLIAGGVGLGLLNGIDLFNATEAAWGMIGLAILLLVTSW